MFDIRAHDTTPPAPGDLELVQRFMNLHEHTAGVAGDLPPAREVVEGFLHERGLLPLGDRLTEADQQTALRLVRALHAKVRATLGRPPAHEEVAVIDELAERAGLRPSFGGGLPVLEPRARGVAGALGRLVAIAFLAHLDGSWEHLKECDGQDCSAVFYDRSKNHSGRWCSMSRCGNRAKVRAWRERQRVGEPA